MSAVVEVGQRWRAEDGYLMDVVGVREDGWVWVRHPNAKRGVILTNPAWFERWERVR